jgi:hypothetical protein
MCRATDLLYPLQLPPEADLIKRAETVVEQLNAWEADLPMFLRPSQKTLTGQRIFESNGDSDNNPTQRLLTFSRTEYSTQALTCTCSYTHQPNIRLGELRDSWAIQRPRRLQLCCSKATR